MHDAYVRNERRATIGITRTIVRRMVVGAWILLLGLVLTGPASAATREADARAVFVRFVAAQNAHDVDAVTHLLWDSPKVLWFTRGVELRGKPAISATLADYYAGTWQVEPDMSGFEATELADDVVQILVPIKFTRGHVGETPQSNTFLISQTLVRDRGGWRIAAILPVANTQFK